MRRRRRTLPGPAPRLVARANGPAIDSGAHVADSLDNLALRIHGLAQAIRHEHGGSPVPSQRRRDIGESLRTTADEVHPEGRRATG